MLTLTNCPLCDKEFCIDGGLDFGVSEEIRIHIIEHHHITEKKYFEISDALTIQKSLNEICSDMNNAILEFSGKIETLKRIEANDFFGNEIEWGTRDIELRERI